MALEKVTNHIEQAQDNLVEQFKNKVVVKKFVDVFVSQIQDLEDAFFDLLLKRDLNTATGVHLDTIGDIVGQARNAQSDPRYSQSLQARILLNNGSGTPEDIIALVEALVGADKTIKITEDFPAHFDVEVLERIFVNGFPVGTFVQLAKPAGVRAIFIWNESQNPFRFDTPGSGFDEGEFSGAVDF